MSRRYNVTNGNMTVSNVYAYSNTNKWEAGAIVSIKMEGEIPSKHILAGTLKFKIYELGVRYFIDAGEWPRRALAPARGSFLTPDDDVCVCVCVQATSRTSSATTRGAILRTASRCT